MVELNVGYTFELNVNINNGADLISELFFTSKELNVNNKKLTQIDKYNYLFELTPEETSKIVVDEAYYSIRAVLIDGNEEPLRFNEMIVINHEKKEKNYVSKDDFLEFSGLDLEIEFANGNYDVDDMPDIFIKRVQNEFINILKSNYPFFKNKMALNCNEFETIEERNGFKQALLEQILFVLKTGKTNEISPNAYNALKACSLISLYPY